MNKKTETIFGVAGGSIGVLIAAVIFYVSIINIWPSGGSMIYGTSEVFGISDPFLIMMGLGTVTLAFGLIGIAGGIVAKTDKKKGGKLMLASGILGIALFFWMWILPGLLLTIGGIIAIRTSE